MNKAATTAIADVDVVIFLVDKTAWTEEDEQVARQLQYSQSPVILAVNKIDQIEDKEQLLPHLQKVVRVVKG